jgi:hypothetical protein
MSEMWVGESRRAAYTTRREALRLAEVPSDATHMTVDFHEGLDHYQVAAALAAYCEKAAGIGVSADGKVLYLAAKGDSAEDVQQQFLELGDVKFPDGQPRFFNMPGDAYSGYVLSVLHECAKETGTPAVALRGHEVFFALPDDANEQVSIDRDRKLKAPQRGVDPWAALKASPGVEEDVFDDQWAQLAEAPTQVHAAFHPVPVMGDASTGPDLGDEGDGNWVDALYSRGLLEDHLLQPPTGFPPGYGDDSDLGTSDERSARSRKSPEEEGPAHPKRRRRVIATVALAGAAGATGLVVAMSGGHAGGAGAQSGPAPTSVTAVLSSSSLAPQISAKDLPVAALYNPVVKALNACEANNNAHAAKGVVAQAQTALNQDNCNAGIVQQAITWAKGQGDTQATTALDAANNEIEGQISAVTHALNTRNSAVEASQLVTRLVKYWPICNAWVAYHVNHPHDASATSNSNAAWGAVRGWALQANGLATQAGLPAPFGAKALNGSLADILANGKTAQRRLQTVIHQNGPLQNALNQASPVG